MPTETRLMIPGPAGQLDTIKTVPDAHSRNTLAILCHPHPLFEGTMNNKVVTTLSRTFVKMGITTLRFNFRGVGKSDGEYGEVVGEQDDLRAVIDWVLPQHPDHTLWLAGFSFGSFIAASMANERDDVKQLVSIAPPVHHADFASLTNIHCPWLVVQGDQDEIVPFEQVQAWALHPPSPLDFVVCKGVSHFFHGKLIELSDILSRLDPAR